MDKEGNTCVGCMDGATRTCNDKSYEECNIGDVETGIARGNLYLREDKNINYWCSRWIGAEICLDKNGNKCYGCLGWDYICNDNDYQQCQEAFDNGARWCSGLLPSSAFVIFRYLECLTLAIYYY